jgi:putative protein-disulfide isomerase
MATRKRMEQNQGSVQRNKSNRNDATEDRIVVNYYTDPLCCWCWAFEPTWRSFIKKYGEQIQWSYVLGGMIKDWKSFSDPMNAVTKPLQMGPVWMHAAQISGVPINHDIWHKDPPTSSYPSSLAVKAASLHSPEAADIYLQTARKAVMLESRNISKQSVLLELAAEVSSHVEGFSVAQFEQDLKSPVVQELFRKDVQKTAYHKIGRFPTLTFVESNGTGVIMTGYRSLDAMEKAVQGLFNRKSSHA